MLLRERCGGVYLLTEWTENYLHLIRETWLTEWQVLDSQISQEDWLAESRYSSAFRNEGSFQWQKKTQSLMGWKTDLLEDGPVQSHQYRMSPLSTNLAPGFLGTVIDCGISFPSPFQESKIISFRSEASVWFIPGFPSVGTGLNSSCPPVLP